MLVKDSPLQFIFNNGSQKNLISVEVMKQLGLPTIAHAQLYTIGWLHQGRDLRVSQQCRLPSNIKPFTDEVSCDISPLDVCDVLLGQPYLWKQHALYESRPRVIIVTLGNKLYRIPELASPTTISSVTTKQCSKLISKTRKFIFLMICPQGKKKIVATTSRQGPSRRKLKMDKIVEEYEDIFTSPYGFLFTVRYLIPWIDDILEQIKGAKYFSKIDLKSGYHHVPIEPFDVWKIAFKANKGLFKWLVMPFGLMNSPATFVRLTDDILAPFTISFVVVYLDDILIFRQSWEEHLHHIQ
eukprot:PITA_30860